MVSNDKSNDNVLIWLPSPIGDAVLSTAALRTFRGIFADSKIYFMASKMVKDLLTPNNFCDEWICPESSNPFNTAKLLKRYNFTHVVLLKNSLGSAVTCFLAGIETRIGYVRDGRGFFLNVKLYPPKLDNGKYKPYSMVDYYMAIAGWLGGDCEKTNLELAVDNESLEYVNEKLGIANNKPRVILVPGGAFGPSKCWASERFAKVADELIDKYNAQVLINVAPKKEELEIADEIIAASENELINLGQYGFSLGQIKSVFSTAELVITNDTGPRHIAIALGKKVISLFGPNDPAWTDTGWEKEIQIVGTAECAPCAKKTCFKEEHICMNSITPDMVMEAAGRLLDAE